MIGGPVSTERNRSSALPLRQVVNLNTIVTNAKLSQLSRVSERLHVKTSSLRQSLSYAVALNTERPYYSFEVSRVKPKGTQPRNFEPCLPKHQRIMENKKRG